MLTVKKTYLYEDDKPFFYLGDTAWLLFDKMKEEDTILYLKNRSSLGYNVIQSVLVYCVDGLNSGKPHKGRNVREKEYWHYVKKIVNYAKTLGLYFGLLPSWGSVVKDGLINELNAKQYASFLGEFFKECDNVIWILGGDVRGDTSINTFNILGETLKKYNEDRLITFHPFGRTGSYLWFNEEKWLDFNMFQSGHRRYDQLTLGVWDDKASNEDSFGEDNYKYVLKNKTYTTLRPILDGEPSYEGIVQGLHDSKEPYWEARHIRRYLYWSILEGACGFTYGNNAIMQFYENSGVGSYGVRETWKEALSAPGGAMMQYGKDLFLHYDFTKGEAHPEYVITQKERHHRISVFSSDDYIICYDYKGDEFELSLDSFSGDFDGYWVNPENGSRSYFGSFKAKNHYKFRPIRRREISNDWILILEKNND